MSSKIVFINGSVEEGSLNDILLRHLCRDDWKAALGCEAPVLKPGCSPGYDPDTYWLGVVERERRWTNMQKTTS
jgi:NAD(P)H-dependent FMN reductase